MFFHNYKYRLKCIVRDKETMFWTFLFPILLATLFNLAFSNLSSAENFSKIKVAVVNDEEYKKNTAFIKAIESVSKSGNTADKSNLFEVTYASKRESERLLQDNKIEGYIYLDNGIKLAVQKSCMDQTIIKAFLDDFQQTSSTIATIVDKSTSSLGNGFFNRVEDRKNYVKTVSISKAAPDTTVNYFYTLIAMACLYGSFCGLKEINAVQANLTSQAARVNLVPVHKMKLFLASMFAAVTVQLIEIAVLLCYLEFVLKVNFGGQLGYITLTCLIGTITGVTFGTCVSSLIKKGEGIKIAVLISVSMTMSFLSGMMYDKMKYIINTKAPVLGYLNPANLITDSFYSLYYYDTHTQFFMDIALLCGFTAVFSTITYLVLRRQKYANL